jgi:hypothetical protein
LSQESRPRLFAGDFSFDLHRTETILIALHTPSATQALPKTLTPAEEPDEASPA